MDAVQKQYERFPYPPVPAFALPQAGQGEKLAYGFGAALANRTLNLSLPVDSAGRKILVAGCGTLETLVIAQNHPNASEIVAVDISERSLHILKKRLALAKVSRWLRPFARGGKSP